MLAVANDRPIGVGPGDDRLFAFDLESGNVRWSVRVESASAPSIVGELVITVEADHQIVWRSLATGESASRACRASTALVQ